MDDCAKTMAYRWLATRRPSFEEQVAEPVYGRGWVPADQEFKIPFPSSIASYRQVVVATWSGTGERWRTLDHDWIGDGDGRDEGIWWKEVRDRRWPRRPAVKTHYFRHQVGSVFHVERSSKEVMHSSRPLPGAIVTIAPYHGGFPAFGPPVLESDEDGFVQHGPLEDTAWYADVSAADHCPVRVLLHTYPKGELKEWDILLWPSRRRIGRIIVDGGPPPTGTTLLVKPEVLGLMDKPTYYAVHADGSFVVDEPIQGLCYYKVELPDGRHKAFGTEEAPPNFEVRFP